MDESEQYAAGQSEFSSTEEVHWTDDSIRWEGGLRVKTTSVRDERLDGGDSDDEEDYVVDPFKDPDPFVIFSFRFMVPVEEAGGEEDGFVDIRLRGYKTDADEVWQSTGLTLWRASDYLCRYQMENLRLFRNMRILELGAGLGLNGILAWRSTASSPDTRVCITDGDSDALVHLRENLIRNRGDDENDETAGKVSCHQLIWGEQSSEQFLSNVANNRKYDIILASDIIYSAVIVEPLWATVKTLLKGPNDNQGCQEEDGGVFVMAYARREVPVSIELVLRTAIENGFVYELVKGNDEEGIWVYTFRYRYHGGATASPTT